MESLHGVSQQEVEQQLKRMHSQQEAIARTNFELLFGVSRVIGGRKHQEDEYTCVDYLSKRKGPAFFAVFDGHGTDDYSAFASSTLYKLLLENPLFKAGQYVDAIKACFAQEDKILLEKMGGERGGSTSTVALIVGDELYIGHIGDSRAVLAVEQKVHTHNVPVPTASHVRPVRISRDHKPDDPEEKKRILEAGGLVLEGRVIGANSAIDMSRAFGDYDFKTPMNRAQADFISSVPYVPMPVLLTPSCKFLVLASDGLWNQMDERSVVNIVNELWNSGCAPTEIANNLTSKLAGPDGYDNVTVIVVFFIWNAAALLSHGGVHTDEVLVSKHESTRVAP